MNEADELRRLVRSTGLRATSARVAVLRVLRRAEVPLSHAEIAVELEHSGVDRGTIFRNLADLSECGLLKRSELGDHVWRFSVVDPQHPDDGHPHFVCAACGSVTCLHDGDLEAAVRRVAADIGQTSEVLLRGICSGCDRHS